MACCGMGRMHGERRERGETMLGQEPSRRCGHDHTHPMTQISPIARVRDTTLTMCGALMVCPYPIGSGASCVAYARGRRYLIQCVLSMPGVPNRNPGRGYSARVM